MDKSCRNCMFRYPDKRPEYEGSGYCRRHPPQVSQWTHPDYNGPQYDQHWPWMNADDWCGEYLHYRSAPNPP